MEVKELRDEHHHRQDLQTEGHTKLWDQDTVASI